MSQDALYWSPRGGNNVQDGWGSCHKFSSEQTNPETGKVEKDTVIVDLGRHEHPVAFGGGQYDRVVPDLADCLEIPNGEPVDESDKAKAIFLTHGHSDHISGVFAYAMAGVKLPPVYGSEFTLNMVKKGFVERGIPADKQPELRKIEAGQTVEIGNLKIRSMRASHSIPGALSFKISNASTSIFHTGDTKGDESSYLQGGVNFADYASIAAEGKIDLMTFDGTTAARDGHATYESEVFDCYDKLISENRGRQLIVPLAAAHCERLATVVAAAEKNGRNVVLNGGESMDTNLLGLQMSGIDLAKKFPNIAVVGAKNPKADALNAKDTVTITTGIYMEKDSPFVQYLQGKNNGFKLDRDAVIIAPLTTDKNEKMAFLLATSERAKGHEVITAASYPKMYGSGHAQADDFRRIAGILKPRMVAPIHTRTPGADDFNKLAAKEGYGTFPRQIKNGEAVKVTNKGCELIPNDRQQWFGVKINGSTAEFTVIKDNSFKTAELKRQRDAYRAQKQTQKRACLAKLAERSK